MKGLGWSAIVLAAVSGLWAVFMTTTVHSDPSYISGIGLTEAKDTYNLGLQQMQMMLLHASLAFLITGTLLCCFGELISSMRRAGTAQEAPPRAGWEHATETEEASEQSQS